MPTRQRLVIESMFQIVDKDSQVVPFRLNKAQADLDEAVAQVYPRVRFAIPKARQRGISSYWLAFFAVECLSRPNTRAVVISHETEATQRMLAKVEFYLENLRGPKPVIATHNRNELSFPKTNSVFYIGTAGARKFGRGDTITHLLASEIAYWPDPKTLAAGLFQAVPVGGVIAAESTGNGSGNYYHNLCVRALKAQGQFKLYFLPWHTDPEYRAPVTPEETSAIMGNLDVGLEEPELVTKYGLDAGQLVFRRNKLDELDYDLQMWNQEYPSCFTDCFQAAGAGIFNRVNHVPTPLWKRSESDKDLWLLEGHPRQGRSYLIGGDVGAGVRKDNSVLEIFDLETLEQVGEWFSNRIEPDAFAHKASALARDFNEAYIGIEANNHGILTLSELKRDKEIGGCGYPLDKIHRIGDPGSKPDPTVRLSNMGVRTTSKSKPLMIGKLRQLVKRDMLIHSELLRNEMSTFVEHEDGSMGAQENCFDDTVMAAAVAAYILPRAQLNLPSDQDRSNLEHNLPNKQNPMTLDYELEKLKDRGSMFGVPSEYGAASDYQTTGAHSE